MNIKEELDAALKHSEGKKYGVNYERKYTGKICRWEYKAQEKNIMCACEGETKE